VGVLVKGQRQLAVRAAAATVDGLRNWGEMIALPPEA
jgi:hypothetical protein